MDFWIVVLAMVVVAMVVMALVSRNEFLNDLVMG
jgi:hypothetical protein